MNIMTEHMECLFAEVMSQTRTHTYSLIPQIMKPIRITTTTVTLIDNIYSNDILGEHNQLQGILYYGIYEPLPIFILTTLNNDKQDYVTIETRNIYS